MNAVHLPATVGHLERKVLAEYCGFIRTRFGSRVRDLRLFGSRARGEGHEDSDLDVLVVIDDLSTAERREIWDLAGDLLTLHDIIVGGMALSSAEWNGLRERERLIVREIDRDGIPL